MTALPGRSRALALLSLLALAMLAGAAPAADRPADVVGAWDLTVQAADGVYSSWLEVRKSGTSTLVGQFVGHFGSARPISRVEFQDGRLRFTVPPQWEKQTDDLVFEGRLDGDTLKGQTKDEQGRPAAWTGRRAPLLRPKGTPAWGEPVELFDGKTLAGWKPRHADQPHGWIVRDGVLVNARPGNDLVTDKTFGDFRLHAEFRYPPRSNSGIYLRGRYEVQIEDTPGEIPDSHGIGGVYGFLTPSVMAARKPGEWQTMDITLVGRVLTLLLNGERVIDRQAIPGITGGALDSREGEPGPIMLQGDHGSIEFRKLTLTPAADKAPAAPAKPSGPSKPPAPGKPDRPGKPDKPASPSGTTSLPRRPEPPRYQPRLPRGQHEEVVLASPAADLAVGGGGRYLVLHLPQSRLLSVYDVQAGKVVRDLPAAEETLHFAAGLDQVVVLYPASGTLQVWSLATGEKQRSALLPDALARGPVQAVCLGSASTGPLFAYLPREKRTVALDLATLETRDVQWSHFGPQNAYGPHHLRVSADGSMLLGHGGGWAGLESLRFAAGRQQPGGTLGYSFSMGAFALPSPDGRRVYLPGSIVDGPATLPEPEAGAYMLPAHERGFFLTLRPTAGRPANVPQARGGAALPPLATAGVYGTDGRKLFSLEAFEEWKGGSAWPWEKAIHYYPAAGLLISVPPARDRLVLRRVNLAERLAASGTDYLCVVSQPPLARPGKTFTYRLDVRSRRGEVRVKLEHGPEGMSVSPEGEVRWDVPATFDRGDVPAVVAVRDGSGQEILHRFTLAVGAP